MALAISRVAGIAEPQRRYMWEVLFTRTPSGVSFPEGLKIRARSTTVPGRTFDRIELNYLWMNWAVQGREGGDKEIDLEFWEGTDSMTRKALVEWAKKCGDWASGVQGSKEEVSGEIVLKLLDGKGNPTRTFVLKNVMVLSVEGSEVSYDANDVVVYRARIWYDYFEEQ